MLAYSVLADPELRAKYDLLYLSALNAEVRVRSPLSWPLRASRCPKLGAWVDPHPCDGVIRMGGQGRNVAAHCEQVGEPIKQSINLIGAPNKRRTK